MNQSFYASGTRDPLLAERGALEGRYIDEVQQKLANEQYFKALADSTRLRILNLLLHGELCVCDIQYALDISQPTASRHLAYLKNSGLVLDARDGYRIFYRLDDRNESLKKLLYDFLRDAFRDQSQLKEDTGRLKEAISVGACAVSEWKPYAGIDVAAVDLTLANTRTAKR